MNKPTPSISLLSHGIFLLLSSLILLSLFTLLRAILILYNYELVVDTSSDEILHAFFMGLRFDLRLTVIASIPLIFALLSYTAMAWRSIYKIWLLVFISVVSFFGLVELDFYHEFHQRLNSLVFQYLEQDPDTVLSMLWHGFPIVKMGLVWIVIILCYRYLLHLADHVSQILISYQTSIIQRTFITRFSLFLLCTIIAVIAARGTLRQGPPLRWGDAYVSKSVFANQMALNGTLTLYSALKAHLHSADKHWTSDLTMPQAKKIVRNMLLSRFDQLRDPQQAVIRRVYTPLASNTLAIKNVVVILMESFSGHYTGALGDTNQITPAFDALAKKGLLFTRFFSNGSHTHQGLFATMACFPNLPGFEYLMQQPEGAHQFSGLPTLLSQQGFADRYIYNGDFSWDNQYGFFRNQGMQHFIGRNDFINPIVNDPTWGVSDQDMFNRAVEEFNHYHDDKPLYALLQTLSNHTPYALPDPLPIKPVTDQGSLNAHLTAMRYADWALGEFFKKIENTPFYQQTLFVIVGDHGFSDPLQITEMDLHRFYVPLLFIAPGIQEKFGQYIDTVGTQVDIVPTILGRLGTPTSHQCWGRDLLNLQNDDVGFGIIKPSGSDQRVALIQGNKILIHAQQSSSRLYQYQMGASPQALAIQHNTIENHTLMESQLDAYLYSATQSLINNTTGNK